MEVMRLFLQSLFLILHFTFGSSYNDTLAINQTLTDDGNLLISNENNFAFGFFSPGKSKHRYLGIWYHKIPQQTVVWVANRNHPIKDSSGVLSINQLGNLILHSNHSHKVPLWSTNVSIVVTDTCVAQLLDSGNLVLVEDTSKVILWQSFDHPTDTHLPGMKIGVNRKTGVRHFLTSWRSADDPGTGDYTVGVYTKGSPQAFIYRGSKPYWRRTLWSVENYEDVRNIKFVNNQDEVYSTYLPTDASLILRIVLHYSGLIKHLVWHESEGEWKDFCLATKPECDSYGHCGTYSKCDVQTHSAKFECHCLPGYEPKSLRDWNILRDGSGGCVRKRLESSSFCMPGEGFVKVAHVKLPDTSAAVWSDTNMSPMDCELQCRRNCSCTAYAIINIGGKGTGCLAWYGELMDTSESMDERDDIYVRVDAIELAERRQKSHGFLEGKDILAILVVSVVSAWFVIIFAYLWLKKKKRRARSKWSKRLLIADSVEVGGSMSHRDSVFFNLSTILTATNNFSLANQLGQGGFGSVYKGQLANGQEIAVKKLAKNSRQGIEEFKNEVMLISKLQHNNLVKLLGCCIKGEEPMLIYEYLPNKSLDSFLFDETKRSVLDWKKRFDIIVGIARGILYIHQDSRLRIIHRDLKTSNILLDAEMNPKISDFGLARIFKGDQIQEITQKIVGTFGYMSPEYVVFGKFSTKSDVFSYGVILLEIITGKKNSSFSPQDSHLSLIEHVWLLWREERVLEIVDASLKESCPPPEALRCIQIGLLCVQKDVSKRPSVSTVFLMLNSETTLPSPGQPAFILGESFNNSLPVTEEGFYSSNMVTSTEIEC